MQTNRTSFFKLERFIRLARAHCAENLPGDQTFLLTVTGIYGLCVLFIFFIPIRANALINFQAIMFFTGLIPSGIIFASRYFSALRKPESSLTLLMRPASTFEKWLLAVLIILVVYPAAYSIIITSINFILVDLGYILYITIGTKINQTPELNNPEQYIRTFIPLSRTRHIALFLIYASCTAVMVLGSIYFKKIATLKTAIIIFVIFLTTLFLVFAFGLNIYYLSWWSGHSHYVLQRFRPEYSTAQITWLWWINIQFWLLVPALLWLCSLVALYERDLV